MKKLVPLAAHLQSLKAHMTVKSQAEPAAYSHWKDDVVKSLEVCQTFIEEVQFMVASNQSIDAAQVFLL